ncbi:porin family protein [uncultured Microscilla sp.]|uniref:porin family protein n=1 Tax=uncultured Microscilla sp. TaxID=432653 RepID=UPI00261F9C23|nr:porin family protein [uncultured Microscilla sp.]
MLKRIYLLLFACLFAIAGYAQKEKACKDKLKDATRAYDEGRVSEVEILIKDCLKDLDRAKQKEAYRLLTLSGLYLDDRDMAEHNMREFLRIEKEYKPVRGTGENADQPEFVELFDKFHTKPIYLYGLKLGVSYSITQSTMAFSVDDNAKTSTFNPRVGFLIGGMFDIPVTDNLHLGAEAYYATRNYTHTESLLGFTDVVFQENQSMVEVPVYARYLFGNTDKRFRPFVTAGVFADLVLSSTAEVTRTDLIGDTKKEFKLLGEDMTPQRKKLNFGAMVGAGFLLKTKGGFFTVDFRYNFGLTNIVKTSERGANVPLIYRYGYIDDNMVISPFTFSLGFFIPKYNPRLKKEYRRVVPQKSGNRKRKRRRKK